MKLVLSKQTLFFFVVIFPIIIILCCILQIFLLSSLDKIIRLNDPERIIKDLPHSYSYNHPEILIVQDLDRALQSTQNRCEFARSSYGDGTDSNGFICAYPNADSNCCDNRKLNKQYDCENCDIYTHCCKKYSNCVSCCLHPTNENSVINLIKSSPHPIIHNLKSQFEFCSYHCRTSSASTFYETQYRSIHMFCYDRWKPPLKKSFIKELSNPLFYNHNISVGITTEYIFMFNIINSQEIDPAFN